MKYILILIIFGIGSVLNAQSEIEYNTKANNFRAVKLDKNLMPTESETYKFKVFERCDEAGKPAYEYSRGMKELGFKGEYFLYIKKLEDSVLLTGTIYVLKITDEFLDENMDFIENNIEPYEENILRIEIYKNGHPIYIENRELNKHNEIVKVSTFDFLTPCRDKGFSYQVTNKGEDFCFCKEYGRWSWVPYYESFPVSVDSKYPYFKNTPALIGLIGSYNLIKNNQIELGVMMNLGNMEMNYGSTYGYSLSYLRPLDRNLNTIALDMGVYTPVTLGMGLNSNFDDQKNHILGYKLFAGTTFYHTSLIYEYNFFRNKNNTVLDLNHHTLKVKVMIPLFKIWKE